VLFIGIRTIMYLEVWAPLLVGCDELRQCIAETLDSCSICAVHVRHDRNTYQVACEALWRGLERWMCELLSWTLLQGALNPCLPKLLIISSMDFVLLKSS
jgi:hypothetical protein